MEESLMRAWTRLDERGFTLIELMIVVAIVGVLSALAIYGVRKYLSNAKTAEVRNALGQMAKDAEAAYERETMPSAVLVPGQTAGVSNNLCTSASSPVPADKDSIKGKKYQSKAEEWSVDLKAAGKGFGCLRFSLSDPQYFMYSYTGEAGPTGTFTARGQGDLNGDGNLSDFALSGQVKNGVVMMAPNFTEVNPEE
jgi:type IV pilus assembly protein PilA